MPQQEKKVVSKLSELKIDSFLPLVKTVRNWHDRRKIIECPLFPSYVFVNIKSKNDYFNSISINGIVTYVRVGKTLAQVNDTIIKNIQMALTNCSNLEITSNQFKPGTQLIIKEGPLAGFSCEMIKYKGNDKALVRINLLDRNLLLDIPSKYIAQ